MGGGGGLARGGVQKMPWLSFGNTAGLNPAAAAQQNNADSTQSMLLRVTARVLVLENQLAQVAETQKQCLSLMGSIYPPALAAASSPAGSPAGDGRGGGGGATSSSPGQLGVGKAASTGTQHLAVSLSAQRRGSRESRRGSLSSRRGSVSSRRGSAASRRGSFEQQGKSLTQSAHLGGATRQSISVNVSSAGGDQQHTLHRRGSLEKIAGVLNLDKLLSASSGMSHNHRRSSRTSIISSAEFYASGLGGHQHGRNSGGGGGVGGGTASTTMQRMSISAGGGSDQMNMLRSRSKQKQLIEVVPNSNRPSQEVDLDAVAELPEVDQHSVVPKIVVPGIIAPSVLDEQNGTASGVSDNTSTRPRPMIQFLGGDGNLLGTSASPSRSTSKMTTGGDDRKPPPPSPCGASMMARGASPGLDEPNSAAAADMLQKVNMLAGITAASTSTDERSGVEENKTVAPSPGGSAGKDEQLHKRATSSPDAGEEITKKESPTLVLTSSGAAEGAPGSEVNPATAGDGGGIIPTIGIAPAITGTEPRGTNDVNPVTGSTNNTQLQGEAGDQPIDADRPNDVSGTVPDEEPACEPPPTARSAGAGEPEPDEAENPEADHPIPNSNAPVDQT
ncbi:unnamed protein product [Amoebophrya sp. A25]|nr:unnamed protein product [Amoebophrya sp. A25]|eukprot:GSA25T00000890001.1